MREAANVDVGLLVGQAVLLLLALMVIIEFGVGVLNEKSGHLDQVYFTFNLSQTLADAVDGADDYRPSTGDALLAWQSSNASDPFSLSLLTNDSASAVANASQWPATPNVGRKHPRQRMPPPPCPLVSPLLGTSLPSTLEVVVCVFLLLRQ